jgi:probable F420-dependent oxidoreductase
MSYSPTATRASIVYPYAPGGRLPGGPSTKFPDPLIWLTWVAAATTRLRFMTAVMILPQRNPLVLAKEVATLDYLSGGRIELGIGVGWLKEEFEALGIPFERRGKRADEYVAAMRALWAGDGASFAGEFVKFDKVSCNPKPVAKSVPIVVGGHSEAAALRAVDHGRRQPRSVARPDCGSPMSFLPRPAATYPNALDPAPRPVSRARS